MLSDEQIQKILCKALRSPLLILTVSDNTAQEMRADIISYIKNNRMGTALANILPRYYILFRGGFENIIIMPQFRWEVQAKFPFKGNVYITNSGIENIPHITSAPLSIMELFKENMQI